MLQALIVMAAEGETSKAPFYISGGALAAFAVVVGVIGIRSHEKFPPGPAAARVVMGLAMLLVAATMVTAITTA